MEQSFDCLYNGYFIAQDGDLNMEQIFDCLYKRAPPPPNQSTQCQPLSSTDFLYQAQPLSTPYYSCNVIVFKIS